VNRHLYYKTPTYRMFIVSLLPWLLGSCGPWKPFLMIAFSGNIVRKFWRIWVASEAGSACGPLGYLVGIGAYRGGVGGQWSKLSKFKFRSQAQLSTKLAYLSLQFARHTCMARVPESQLRFGGYTTIVLASCLQCTLHRMRSTHEVRTLIRIRY
jgi:hypothetical protein